MIKLPCPNVEMVVGPPGTGKTTEAILEVKKALGEGIKPDSIGFISFTKQAISEASDRIMIYPTPKWFRTLHSMCYNLTGKQRDDLIDPDEIVGMRERFGHMVEKYLFMVNLARVEKRPLSEIWEYVTQDYPVNQIRLNEFERWYTNYKNYTHRIDFIDLLEEYLEHPVAPHLDLVIVDEAQDLTLLQWEVVKAFVKNTKKVILFGDADQSIYDWAGVKNVLETVEYSDIRVLEQSHRVPIEVHKRAEKILQLRGREINYKPRNARGSVSLLSSHHEWQTLDLSQGDWLLLVRTNYQIGGIIKGLYEKGIMAVKMDRTKADPRDRVLRNIKKYIRMCEGKTVSGKSKEYLNTQVIGGDAEKLAKKQIAWDRAFISLSADQIQYYRKVLEMGDSIRVRVSTFHGAKGAEADNVIIFGKQTLAVKRGIERDPDPELRLLYVAVTRARENLYLSPGDGRWNYDWMDLLW